MRDTLINLYRKLFGTPAGMGPQDAGVQTILDGDTAVAVTEACIANNGVIAPGFLSGSAGVAWRSEQSRQQNNVFGELLGSELTDSPRGVLAQANGLAMSGRRAAVFLSAADLVAAQDLLVTAVGRRLPLVVHVTNLAQPGQGISSATSHTALHQILNAGCVVLFANGVQQAVDCSLIGRRVAETALLPVLVVMDGKETASSMQNVHLLSPGLIQRYLGKPDELVACDNTADKLLWGEERRRVPRWHDLDRPVLQGALFEGESYGLAQAAQRVFFNPSLNRILDDAGKALAHETGRDYQSVTASNAKKAKTLMVVQGAASLNLQQAAELIGKTHKIKVGVISINRLRPLPTAELVAFFKGRERLVVLERANAPLAEVAGDPPLMSELRALLEKAAENERYGSETHEGIPAMAESERPRMHSVIYGIGGTPLRMRDLLELGAQSGSLTGARKYLGINFDPALVNHPKRQVLLDTLRRDYPQLAALGLRGETIPRASESGFNLTLRTQAAKADGLMPYVCSFLQELLGGSLCAEKDDDQPDWGNWRTERLNYAPDTAACINVDLVADVVLLIGANQSPGMLNDVVCADNTVLVFESDDNALPKALYESSKCYTYQSVQEGGQKTDPTPSVLSPQPSALRMEARLGALIGVLVAEQKLPISQLKLLSSREAFLNKLHGVAAEKMLVAFTQGLESVTRLESIGVSDAGTHEQPVPMLVRHLGGHETGYDSLPRFWDQTGILYRNGEQSQLTPDPYLATGVMPPLSATFRDFSSNRSLLPEFDAEACSGCGKCWSACPDGAIAAVAVSPTDLINSGIGLGGADALRPLASKLGGRISARARKSEFQGADFASLLAEAASWLQQKAPLEGERKANVEAAVEKLSKGYGALSFAVTDPLFAEGEKASKDGGELLALAINPDACKACGLCVAVCQDDAMNVAPQGVERLQHSRSIWQAWEQTPDTGSATIGRVADNADMGAMAAQLLSRYSLLALASGDGAEPGSGEKIATRLALATIEYRQQPLLHRFSDELSRSRDKINQAIREALVEALPTEDLDALSVQLADAGSRQIEIADLLPQSGSTVDRALLARLTTLVQQLDDQYWRITEGLQGLGRARYGLTLANGDLLQWAASFPHNPFQVPVAVDANGDSAQLAAGLLQGQLQEMLETVRLLRKAKMATGDMGRHALDPDRLSWQDLDDDEQSLCSPMILLGNEQTLGGRNFSQIAWLLNSALPIKILVLTELDFALDTLGLDGKPLDAGADPRGNLGLMALSQRNAYVAQTSIADGEHFRDVMRDALAYAGPALVRVHAPSPSGHGFATERTLEQAKLAMRSRAFPLFTYHPEREGVFGLRMDLTGNPSSDELLSSNDAETILTPAHWALTEQRFASHFQPLEDGDPSPTVLTDWIALDQKARSKKTPIISVQHKEDSAEVFKLSIAMAELVENQLHAWQTLQELAGIITPFTERVTAQVKDNLENQHQDELLAAKKGCETQVADTRNGMQLEMADQIRERLLTLAG